MLPARDPRPKLDYVGSVLSAAGLGVFVFGVLQSSTWGWVKPKNSPITIFGFSLTLFVIAAGGVLIWGFVTWQRHREAIDRDPLVHLSLARVPTVRSGLIGLFTQNLILMGVFFVIPLYLQLVLGLSALETGIKMLPVSITMFLTSAIGSRLSNRFAVRSIVRAGLIVTIAGTLILLATIKPTLSNAGFAIGMGVLGIGMGLMVSQLGNVVQSSVEESGRSEAGGSAVHRAAARLLAGSGPHRCDRAHRSDEHVHLQRREGPPNQLGGGGPGGRGRGQQHQLRLVHEIENCSQRGGPRHHLYDGAGRGLRGCAAPLAQGRAPGGRLCLPSSRSPSPGSYRTIRHPGKSANSPPTECVRILEGFAGSFEPGGIAGAERELAPGLRGGGHADDRHVQRL